MSFFGGIWKPNKEHELPPPLGSEQRRGRGNRRSSGPIIGILSCKHVLPEEHFMLVMPVVLKDAEAAPLPRRLLEWERRLCLDDGSSV